MRVFVTGATGWVGSAIVSELLATGHQVTGLTTNAHGAEKLTKIGVRARVARLTDLTALREEASQADGVIHTAFIHDLAHMSVSTRLRLFAGAINGGIVASFMRILAETETNAVRSIGLGLQGTGRPLVVTSGIVNLPQGKIATEDDKHVAIPNRSISEKAAFDLISQGVQSSVVRLAPTVHAAGDRGFIPMIIKAARKKKVSPYVGDGSNRWPTIHRLDAARLFRLAFEKASAGAIYHGVDEVGIPFKDIASFIGLKLNIPTASLDTRGAGKHFGMLAPFVGVDNPASSEWTRNELGWVPEHAGLLDDMRDNYFNSTDR